MNGAGDAERVLAWGQGLYWAAAGAWPLVHMPSFEAVTGPKRERWLVRTVLGRPRRAGREGER